MFLITYKQHIEVLYNYAFHAKQIDVKPMLNSYFGICQVIRTKVVLKIFYSITCKDFLKKKLEFWHTL